MFKTLFSKIGIYLFLKEKKMFVLEYWQRLIGEKLFIYLFWCHLQE